MTTSTNRTLEITEKLENNGVLSSNDSEMESHDEINNIYCKDINDINNHIDNGTITKQIFESFMNKINTTINNYKQQIETYKKTNNNNQKLEILKDPTPKIDVNALISSSQLVTSFSYIKGRSPKCTLFISFYTQFLTMITQNKHDQNAIKSVIYYSDMDRIICVPDRNDDVLLYVKLKKKIPLNWRTYSISCFAFIFSGNIENQSPNDEDTCRSIGNLNTNLPSIISGNISTQFCSIISGLCNKNIDRHDANLFVRKLDIYHNKKSVYYIDATIKFNKCFIYPIRSGIFISPKPLRFISQTKIKYYEYTRQGTGLRYFDLDIVLFDDEKDNNNNNNNNINKKRKKKDNIISLTMIDKTERDVIDYYFKMMNIKLKQDENENTNNKQTDCESDDDEMTLSEDNNNNMYSDSDDEEYKIEDDKYKYSDTDYSDSDYSDSDMNDIDIHIKNKQKQKQKLKNKKVKVKHKKQKKNVNKKKVKKKKSIYKEPVKKKNKKRKRNEVENDGNNKVLNALDVKRFKGYLGGKCMLGRKSIPKKNNGKIVSKTVPKKNRKKVKVIKDDSVESIELLKKKKVKKGKQVIKKVNNKCNDDSNNKLNDISSDMIDLSILYPVPLTDMDMRSRVKKKKCKKDEKKDLTKKRKRKKKSKTNDKKQKNKNDS